jgi:putative transposase
MKKVKHTVTQILGILQEAEALLRAGKTIKEAPRHLKIGESTYYQWRAQYLGVEPDQAKRLKDLEEENRRDLSILREVTRGNY